MPPMRLLFETAPPRVRVAIVFLMAFALHLLTYQEAISIRPSADDFILPVQILAGERDGPMSFFKSSPLKDYRPLQSLVYWAVGRWSIEDPFPLIHVLNFFSFGFFAAVVASWTILLRLSLWGALCSALLLSFHPILAGPVADLDGFTRFVVSGWVWLGALFAVRFANDLRIAVPLTALCLLVGLGFMEYAVGLVPLSVLGLWWARDHKRFSGAAILGSVLLTVFAMYFMVRISVVESGTSELTLSPAEWIRNFAMLLSGIGFMGNTVWVYVHQGSQAYTLLSSAWILLAAMILTGLWSWYRRAEIGPNIVPPFRNKSREAGFLLTMFLASFTPMVFMAHVSEIYTTAIVASIALVAGRSADGWSRLPKPIFLCLGLAFALHLGWAFTSVRSKLSSLRETGDRAAVQLTQLLQWIPSELKEQHIALVFLEQELPSRRTYSVFRAGDDHLLQPGKGVSSAVTWSRPESRHVLKHLIVPDRSGVEKDDFDLVLRWNPASREFESWK